MTKPKFGTGLFGEINKRRHSYGLLIIAWDDWLADRAREHSKYMAKSGKFEHSYFTSDEYILENIFMCDGSYNIRLVMRTWLSSPGHRENLLNPLITRGGTGVAEGRGRTYVTFIGAG